MSRASADKGGQANVNRLPSVARLLESSRCAVWNASVDAQKLVYVNPAAARFFGVAPSELPVDLSVWMQSVHADDRKRVESCLLAVANHETMDQRYRVVSPTGDVVWLQESITLVKDPKGNPLYIGGIALDVSSEVAEAKRREDGRAVLQSLMDYIPMNVLQKDLKGRIVFANERYCNAMNLPLKKLLGKTDFDLFPAELAKKYTADDKRVVELRESIEDIEAHVTPAGRRVYVQVLKAPVYDEEQNVVGLQIMFWDATERKEAEIQLSHERYLLHSFLDNIPDSIYFKDSESRFTRVSRSMAKKFGLESPEAAIGKSDFDFFSAEHANLALDDERELMRSGEPIYDKEERETPVNKEETWCSTTKLPLLDIEGRVVGTFGVSRDITEEKRAKGQLARERDLLKTIIDNVPDMIFVKDRAGRFILANAALLKSLGAGSVEEVIGKTDYDFSTADLACEYVADDQAVMRTGKPLIDQEEVARDKEGRQITILMSKVPLRDNEGDVIGLVGIGRDITARVKNQERLEDAVAAADKANRAKSDFLANMSHEIRTPMNAIIGMTDLVLDSDLTESQREFLMMVKESGGALLNLINDILDFSKIEAGKLELDPVQFNLRETLGSTLKTLAFRAHNKGLELALRVHPEVPSVFHGDVGRLRQIVVNLVANGIKFTHQGEVVVEVECHSEPGEHATLTFVVRDTGIGIDKEKCETIFNEFEQADSSTTRSYGGTGLGLAISTRLVELMGGRIWVNSRLGEGSTFHFSVTLEVGDENGFRKKASVVVGGAPVLILDDNATNRIILEEMVSSWGMIPTQAATVDEARDLLCTALDRGEQYRLVLSDVNMPTEDGFQFAEWLRGHESLSGLPIIMLTSGGRTGDQELRKKWHVAAKLMKPIIQSELFDTIIRVLGDEEEKTNPATPKLVSPTPVAAPTPLANLKILVAEDGIFNQKLAMAILDRRGHRVTVVNNGREAVEAIQQGKFDVVLMDVQMPEMDGLAATQAIRSWQRESNQDPTPIIAMTARALKGDRELCIDAGMDAYVSKPIDPERLFDAITSLVDQDEERFVLDFGDNDGKGGVMESEEEFVDFEAALERLGGSMETARSLGNVFLDECPKLIGEIEAALDVRDGKELRRAAHTLKGSASYFFATPVQNLSERLEEMGEHEEFEEAPDALNLLKLEADKLCCAIQEKFGDPSQD